MPLGTAGCHTVPTLPACTRSPAVACGWCARHLGSHRWLAAAPGSACRGTERSPTAYARNTSRTNPKAEKQGKPQPSVAASEMHTNTKKTKAVPATQRMAEYLQTPHARPASPQTPKTAPPSQAATGALPHLVHPVLHALLGHALALLQQLLKRRHRLLHHGRLGLAQLRVHRRLERAVLLLSNLLRFLQQAGCERVGCAAQHPASWLRPAPVHSRR